MLTVVAADIDLGVFNPVIALAIASIKAVIVILFFMHVKYQSNLIKMTVGAGFFTFLVLITMTLSRLHQPRLGPLVGPSRGPATAEAIFSRPHLVMESRHRSKLNGCLGRSCEISGSSFSVSPTNLVTWTMP